MSDISTELLKLKAHIEKAKIDVAKISGQIEQLHKQRAEEFGCATDEEATTYIQELEGNVTKLMTEIEAGVKTVKEELGWG